MNIIPNFVNEDILDEFENVNEESYIKTTFKKYITNYSKFLDDVEQEFYNGLLMGFVEE